MRTEIYIKRYTDRELVGFTNILTNNGYNVEFVGNSGTVSQKIIISKNEQPLKKDVSVTVTIK